jgi:hypothetical protein
MADLFGYANVSPKAPITADRCTLSFGGVIATAMQVQISYQQQINRRRTIGNKEALLWGSQPQGQANIQRMVIGTEAYGGKGWSACDPADMTFEMQGCTSGGPKLTARAAVVSQFSVTAEAESLTVMDNVVIDFMQLTA